MATNDFLVFAGGSGANVINQTAYSSLSARTNGFQSGIAKSIELNKVWRQSSIMSAALAQLIADRTGADVLDDGTTATILANLKASAPKGTTLYDYGILLATKAEAEAGVDNTKPMTPLRTAQAIAAFFGASQSLTANGYQKLPGGLILQWGNTESMAVGASRTISLPLAFPNTPLNLNATPVVSPGTVSGQSASAQFVNNGQISVSNSGSANSTCSFFWMAIGY